MKEIVMLMCASVLTGCLTSWAVVLMKKWGVTEWMQVHGSRLVSELFRCDYCMNWWLAWAVSVAALLVTGCWWLLAVPFFSTTIGRWLSA